jgi:phosphoribosyl 1,2-cyclic phosphodiesterase
MDVGISRKRTVEALRGIGLDMKDIDGIFITHEHVDHITGLPVIARNSDMPIYATKGTIDAVLRSSKCGNIDPARFVCVRPDQPVTVGDLKVNPMRISHDAADPVGYRIYEGNKKACVCTDLGCFTDYTAECLRDSDVLLLESNHDVNMLMVGAYPYYLKQRILGERGHLSNDTAAELLCKVLHTELKYVILAHLSKENNLPELAYETVRIELQSAAEAKGLMMPDLFVANRDTVSRLVEVGEETIIFA